MRAPGAAARLLRGLTTASSLQQSRALPPGRVGPYRRLVVAPTAGSRLQRAAPGTSTPAAATIIGRRRQPLSSPTPAVTQRQTVCCADRSPSADNGARFLPFLSRCLSFVSYAAGAYGLLFLLFHFYLKPDARFVVNMGLMVASLAAPNCTLWPVGSSVAVAKTAAEAGDPLRALWELLWIPIIPGISFTIFSWGVTLLIISGVLGWLAKRPH